jgi:hypothetical protein
LIVESYGGYVARLSSSDGEKKSVSIVVKVPESAFYKVLAEIRRIGKVIGEDVSVQDVTEQYVDLEAGLRTFVPRRNSCSQRLRRLKASKIC